MLLSSLLTSIISDRSLRGLLWTRRGAPWEESFTRRTAVLACFRGNRKQAPQNFTGGLSYRTKQVGHPFYDPHVEYTSGYLAISGASSTPFSPSRFSLPNFSSQLSSHIRLSDSINFQWMLVKRALLAVIRADMLAKRHVRSWRRYFGRRPRSDLSGETSSLRRKNDRNLCNGEESVGVGGVSGPLVNCFARKTKLSCPIPQVSDDTMYRWSFRLEVPKFFNLVPSFDISETFRQRFELSFPHYFFKRIHKYFLFTDSLAE